MYFQWNPWLNRRMNALPIELIWMNGWIVLPIKLGIELIIPGTYERITKWMNGRITNNSIINWMAVFPIVYVWMCKRINEWTYYQFNNRLNEWITSKILDWISEWMFLPIELSFQLNDTVYVWTCKRMNEWTNYPIQ